MKIAVSNSLNKNLHEQIDANKSNEFGSSERKKVRRRRPQQARKVEKLTKKVGSAMAKQRVENMC